MMSAVSTILLITGGEGHLVLVEAVEHEDGDVEEDDCRVAAEGGRLVLVVGHVARGQDVLAGAVRRDTCLCFSYA